MRVQAERSPSWHALQLNSTPLAECLHGVVDDSGWATKVPKAATSFPAPIALGATFSAELAHRVGSAIGREARAMYNLQLQEDGTVRWDLQAVVKQCCQV